MLVLYCILCYILYIYKYSSDVFRRRYQCCIIYSVTYYIYISILLYIGNIHCGYCGDSFVDVLRTRCQWRGGGLGSRPKNMYGETLGDGVEYHLMKPTMSVLYSFLWMSCAQDVSVVSYTLLHIIYIYMRILLHIGNICCGY